MTGYAGSAAGGGSLAGEVLCLSGLLAQGGFAKEGAPYTFPLDDLGVVGGGGGDDGEHFELSRDDTLELIGLLNSQDLAVAVREFGALLTRMNRGAVQGLTHRLLLVLRRQRRELAALEYDAQKSATAAPSERRQHAVAASSGPRRADTARQVSGPPPPSYSGTARASSGATALRPREPKESKDVKDLQARARLASPVGTASSAATINAGPNAAARGGPKAMPQVFRRLTGPAATGEGTVAAVQTLEGLTAATAILGAALAAREQEPLYDGCPQAGGHLADGEWLGPRTPRVSEERAKEIFDRLHRSGREHRIRRRVYHELGLLVDQAKHEQTCTFVPNVPNAVAQSGCGSVTERLYRDGLDRVRRREDRILQAPTPTFQPRISPVSYSLATSASASALSMSALSHQDIDGADLRDTLADEHGTMSFSSRHERLFREHEERRTRQHRRQEDGAEWRKHSFRPNIAPSQATGPQILRQSSGPGLHARDLGGYNQEAADYALMYPEHVMGPPVSSPPTASSLAAAAAAATASHKEAEIFNEDMYHDEDCGHLDYPGDSDGGSSGVVGSGHVPEQEFVDVEAAAEEVEVPVSGLLIEDNSLGSAASVAAGFDGDFDEAPWRPEAQAEHDSLGSGSGLASLVLPEAAPLQRVALEMPIAAALPAATPRLQVPAHPDNHAAGPMSAAGSATGLGPPSGSANAMGYGAAGPISTLASSSMAMTMTGSAHIVSRDVSVATYHSGVCLSSMLPSPSPRPPSGPPSRGVSGRLSPGISGPVVVVLGTGMQSPRLPGARQPVEVVPPSPDVVNAAPRDGTANMVSPQLVVRALPQLNDSTTSGLSTPVVAGSLGRSVMVQPAHSVGLVTQVMGTPPQYAQARPAAFAGAPQHAYVMPARPGMGAVLPASAAVPGQVAAVRPTVVIATPRQIVVGAPPANIAAGTAVPAARGGGSSTPYGRGMIFPTAVAGFVGR